MKRRGALAIGHRAYAPNGSMAIGDDVDATKKNEPGVLYVGGSPRLAIGKQVLGRECNLQDVLRVWLELEDLGGDWKQC